MNLRGLELPRFASNSLLTAGVYIATVILEWVLDIMLKRNVLECIIQPRYLALS